MEFSALILLIGVGFLHWTRATSFYLGYSVLEINDGLLENVTLLRNTSNLEICDMNLKEIAIDAFDTVTHIKRLDLSNNRIKSLPPEVFSKLSNLRRLSLVNNKLDSHEFDKTFIGLNNLRRLNLSGNNISFIDSHSFAGLPNSASVTIRKSGFSQFNFHGMKVWKENVKKSFNGIPTNIKIQLCMNGDTVDSLSRLKKGEGNAPHCSNIRIYHQESIINLSGRRLKSFNHNWYKLTDLKIRAIDLSYNMLNAITPDLLNDLTIPLTIDLYDAGISVIKKNVMENENCMSLYFGGESLKAIEDEAFSKLCLTELVIEDSSLDNLNFIRTLPVMIEYLTVTNNEISEISPGIFDHLENLRMIDLSLNKLERIEANVFTSLRSQMDIYLDHNEIDFIAQGSFYNVFLHHLSLSYNQITNESIEKGAFIWSNIKLIDLSNNSITNFDEESFVGILNECLIKVDGNPIVNITNLNFRKKNSLSHQ